MSVIGVYGGSFNPPHKGHVKLAQCALTELELDRLVIVPAGDPPHKTLPPGSPDKYARLRLAQLAMEGLDRVEVSDAEIRRPGKSYMVDTLTQLSEENPDCELTLLMGTDMLAGFDKWRQPEKICSMAHLAVFTRSLKDKKDERRVANEAERLRGLFDAQIDLMDNEFIEISSSALRRMLIFGCGDEYIPGPAADMIHEEGLYGVGVDRRGLSLSRLREEAASLLDEKRVPHVMGCEEEAARLARRYGADVDMARRAALLHDITKALASREQLILCDKYGIIVDTFEKETPKLLHAKTGAAVAGRIFGECEQVCQAIRTHTTGGPDMSLLAKVIYLADYIEPNRSFDGVEPLRREVYADLDRGLLMGFKRSIDDLTREGKTLHPMTAQAYEWLLENGVKG